MAGVKEIKDALAAQIQNFTGLTMRARMPDQINPPMGVILPGSPYAKYGVTLGVPSLFGPGPVPVSAEFNLVVAVFVSRAPSLERAQDAVDQYLGLEPGAGQESIPLAIDQDPTLGGVVEFAEPIQVLAYGDVEIAGQVYFQGRISVNVSAIQDIGP